MWHDYIIRVSQTELILTNFHRKPSFLLAILKYLANLNPKQYWSLIFLGWSNGGNNYVGPEDPIYGCLEIWFEVQEYDAIKMNMYMSSYA